MIQQTMQKNRGFTLLDSVLAITLTGITAATAASYLDGWLEASDTGVMEYNKQVAISAMHTHQAWAQATGGTTPEWRDVITLGGVNSEQSADGQLIVRSANSGQCFVLSKTGKTDSLNGRC